MNKETLFSIGYGNKKIEQFIAELKANNIEYVIDVRSKPFSKWNSQFNQVSLKITLENEGIKYAFFGDTLGGLPSDRSCYDENDKVVYEVVKEKEFFKQGIKRLLTAYQKKIPVAIMCSEAKPEECHRSKLIGRELAKKKVPLIHIISESMNKWQVDLMNEIMEGRNEIDIFGNEAPLFSRKSY